MSDDSSSHVLPPQDDSATLQATAAASGLVISDQQSHLLAQYCRLVWMWNSRLNLTRHTDWQLFVTRDLLDTVELAQRIPSGEKVLDIGSGGGVPGIVLAILRPDLHVSLCESIGKKAMALRDIVQSLGLSIPVFADRAELVLKTNRFSVVTARAVASISKLLTCLEPVWPSVGRLLLIKGPKWVDEQTEARDDGALRRRSVELLASWRTPGRDHDTVLLTISNQ